MALTISRRDRWPSCPIRALSQPNGAPCTVPLADLSRSLLPGTANRHLVNRQLRFIQSYIDVRLVRRSRHLFLSDRLERRLRLVRTLFP